MKNLIYFGIFAVVLTVSANANAAVSDLTLNSNEGDSSDFSVQKFKCADQSLVTGYDSEGNQLCGTTAVLDRELVEFEAEFEAIDSGSTIDDGDTGTTTTTKTTATVSSCPSDMTKSSDGCCCVMK